MTYPPTIRAYEYAEPPDEVAVVNACPRSRTTCGVELFELTEHPKPKVSFAERHIAIINDDDGRFPFAPGVDTYTIHWQFSGHANIVEAKLELFVRERALAVWSKTMRWTADERRAESTTRFNGNLRNDYEAVASSTGTVVIAGPADGHATFPGDFLTAEHAPYKLKLSIVEVEPATRVTTRERWLYLDVIATIDLALGPNNWITVPPAPMYEVARQLACSLIAFNDLDADLIGVNGRLTDDAAPADAKLSLLHNVFSKSGLDFYNNTLYRGSFELYRQDPLVPLTATLRVLRANGAAATAAQSAPLLGNLSVYWDWSSGDRPAHPHRTARTFIDAVFQYKASEWPHAAANCHKDHGGKRGTADVHFTAVAALPGPANALTANARRPWSTFTQPVTDPADPAAATAGVFLRPSRIAGDRYRPAAVLAYPARARFDTADADAFAGACANAPGAESRTTITVWRKVTIANHFRKRTAIATNLDWARMNAHFRPAFVELEPPATVTTIGQVNYTAALTAILPSLPDAISRSLVTIADQYNDKFALTFKTWDNYRAAVLVRARVSKLIVTAANAQTTLAVIQAQMAGLAPRVQWCKEDFLIPDIATYRLSDARVADKLLEAIKVTDEGSYTKKLIGWSQLIVERICDDLMRRLAAANDGVSIFQFDFSDNHYHDSPAGLAATTHATPAACPRCAQAPVVAYPLIWWGSAEELDNRFCTGCQLRLDNSAAVIVFAPIRYMDGQSDAFAVQNLTQTQQLKILGAQAYGARADLCVAHEIGHQLGLPHAGPNAVPVFVTTGGVHAGAHDADDSSCLMSYNIFGAAEMHFCGFCTLRLSGWSAGPSDRWNPQHFDLVSDGATIPLHNKASHNTAHAPAADKVWAADADACSACQAEVGWRTRHHCRLCGAVVCGTCSSHTMLVTRPLSSSDPSNLRVCTDCEALPDPKTPPPSARWQTDASSDVCPLCMNAFNDDRKRHHCRLCGALRCNDCAPRTANVVRPVKDEAPQNVRVCNACYAGH